MELYPLHNSPQFSVHTILSFDKFVESAYLISDMIWARKDEPFVNLCLPCT